MDVFGITVSVILAVISLLAIIFDKNKLDKILGALLLVFVAQGLCSYFYPTHIISYILLFLCAPVGLAFIIIAAKRLGELFGKKGK